MKLFIAGMCFSGLLFAVANWIALELRQLRLGRRLPDPRLLREHMERARQEAYLEQLRELDIVLFNALRERKTFEVPRA